MKKALVILLDFLILTNFHCARIQVQTVGSEKVLANFKASMSRGDAAKFYPLLMKKIY